LGKEKNSMKAIVQEKYGSPVDVLELMDIDKPVVKDDEVLVRVHAASVHPDVWHVVRGLPYVLRLMGPGCSNPRTVFRGRMWQATLSRLART
jgi:NADPH:quinone reductase-like Zn-dependent oxidoreductase